MTRGFTLIELLVAMSVLALMATVMVGGLRLGLAASERVDAQTRQMERIHLVQSFLRKEIEQIAVAVDPQGAGAAAFEGAEDHLAFVAPLVARGDYEGLHRFWLGLGDAGEPTAFVMRYGPVDLDATANGGEEQVVLVEDVAALRFDYWNGHAWQSGWHEPNRAPASVRIRLEDAVGRSIWPELIAAPRLTSVAAGASDAGS